MPKKSESEEAKKEAKPTKLSQADFESRAAEMAGKGLSSEKIGEALRREGIHPSKYEKKISRILKEKNIYVNPDLKNMESKLEKINAHIEKNGQDRKALREKTRIFAEIRRLKKYHGVPVK